jgi:hypothetical protein
MAGARSRAVAASRGYALGDRIDVPDAIFRDRPYTLVIFARSSCGASQAMKPLLAAIAKSVSTSDGMGVTLITPMSDRQAEDEFAAEIGIGRRQTMPLDLAGLRVSRVPTLVVVNQQGEVQFVRSGRPSSTEDEAALLEAVTAFGLIR